MANYGARITNCKTMIQSCLSLDGHVAECGVAGGDVTFALDSLVLPTGKKLFALDTFEGLPYSESPCLHKGRFADLHGLFWDRLNNAEKTSIVPVKGIVEDTLKQIEDEKFCFVWLDMDLEDSTRFAYRFFESRMVPGGIIGFHDYDFLGCPGIKKVVDEDVNFDMYENVLCKNICLFLRRK